ncbi:YciI family protein [Streptomyces sp. NPDC051985]|uniref:YciI family protein n=1 Tax=Streptomyces sp. NPDC051985 TaxID=3155807 RepID=UPI0034147084
MSESDPGAVVGALTSRFAGLRLWAVHSSPAPGSAPEDIGPHLVEHLRHIIGWERHGVLFAGGPYLDDDGNPGDSALYLLRADSEAAATALAAEEPLHQHGVRVFSVRPWQLNQGRFAVHIDISHQTGGIDGTPAPLDLEGSNR